MEEITIKSSTFITINELFSKYENDEHMITKLYGYINVSLPTLLENEYILKKKRTKRNEILTQEQHLFCQLFLSKHKYFYLSNTNSLYVYDNKNYHCVKESDISQNLLSQINTNNILKEWKYKTKNLIIRLIKEKTLFKSVPESITIQNVLKFLSPMFLKTKQHAKYFLTILGDNILKKNTSLVFLVSKSSKPFFDCINKISIKLLNVNHSTSCFVYKYHKSYKYENCRLFLINEIDYKFWHFLFNHININFFCVATHYSNRYGSSENYIENKCDESLKQYTLFLKNNSIESIVDTFINDFLDRVEPESHNNSSSNEEKKCDVFISGKDILFIWKNYLIVNKYPSIVYIKNVSQILQNKLEYDKDKDVYYNITSAFLPKFSKFLKFWNETIIYKKETYFEKSLLDDEVEIDEICYLYKKNCGIIISESDVLKIIKHYFKDIVEIKNDKYILNISSLNNDKKSNIDTILYIYKIKTIKQIIQEKDEQEKIVLCDNDISSSSQIEKIHNNIQEQQDKMNRLIHIEDIYIFYAKYYQTLNKYVVNKNYFISYLKRSFEEYIIYEEFLTEEWLFTINFHNQLSFELL